MAIRMITGWLVLAEEDLKPLEFYPDEEEDPEPPISNDNGVLQFHIRLTTTTQGDNYPTLTVEVLNG